MIKSLKKYNNASLALFTGERKEIYSCSILSWSSGFPPYYRCIPSCSFNINFKRSHHNKKFHYHLKAIYALRKGRRTTIVPFEETPVKSLQDLRSKEKCKEFFKGLYGKGGIYKFSLISKPNVFYIGSSRNIYKRFFQHTGKDAWLYHDDLFHDFASNIGWDKFKFEILEVLEELPALRTRENYYLQKYAPLLNMKLKSQISTKRYNKEASTTKPKPNSKNP